MSVAPYPGPCINCGTFDKVPSAGFRLKRCYACYKYHWRHGVERPSIFWTLDKGFCSNCKIPLIRKKGNSIKGRCSKCNHYFWRHGVERPQSLVCPPSPPTHCKNSNCKKLLSDDPYAQAGYCNPCYCYQRRCDMERPKYLCLNPGIIKRNEYTYCRNANCEKLLKEDRRPIRGYCNACYFYHLTRGRKRSKYLCSRPPLVKRGQYTHCKNNNCGIPIFDGHQYIIPSTRGWCNPCYRYYKKYGGKKSRPRELCIEADVLGWCDCGKAAFYEEPITLLGFGERDVTERQEKLLLCKECFYDFYQYTG